MKKFQNTTIEDLYTDMCNEKGIKPKTREELIKEDEKKKAEKKKKDEKKKAERKKLLKNTVRVIKKDRGGVTIKHKGVEYTIGWNEFETIFEPVNGEKFVYRFTDEYMEKSKNINNNIELCVKTYTELKSIEEKGKKDSEEYTKMVDEFDKMSAKLGELIEYTKHDVQNFIKQEYNIRNNQVEGVYSTNIASVYMMF